MRIGAVELGGTKTICAIFDGDSLSDKMQFWTYKPEKTMGQVISYFEGKGIEAIGIAAFGPVCIDEGSEDFGRIYDTVKPGWSHYDILGPIREKLKVPAFLDTDVNAACLGEVSFGSYKGMRNAVYITVGTGIGVGIVHDSVPYHGNMHPEAGHISVGRLESDTFGGICPFHRDCAEGLACGPALRERAGRDPKSIPEGDEMWSIESKYIARLCYSMALTVSPDGIIVGGGVLNKGFLYEMIRSEFDALNNGFLRSGNALDPERYILRPSLDGDQALYGCLKMVLDRL